MAPPARLILYYYRECGFSRSVLNTIANLGIGDEVELRNIRENEAFREELVAACGDEQVPTLATGSDYMRESTAINAYLVDTFLD